MRKGDQLGQGGAKKVFDDLHDKAKVIAELKLERDPVTVKGAFYLGKIIHFIFPENFPAVHAAGVDQKRSFLHVQKIDLDPKHRAAARVYDHILNASGGSLNEDMINALRENTDEKDFHPAVEDLIQKFKEAGIKIDTTEMNFSITPQGVAQYFDIGMPWWRRSNGKILCAYDAQKLSAAIDTLLEPERSQAKICLQSLERLYQQFKNLPVT